MHTTDESLLAEGTRLGGMYRILRPLEKGTQWITYLAEVDGVEAGKQVSLKVTTAGSLRQEAYRLAGIQAGAKSAFPRFYAVFQDGQYSCLAMEYIEGVFLHEYLFGKKERLGRGKLPDEEVVAIGVQLCNALHVLHTHRPSLIFCGLRPESVLLDTQSVVGRICLPDLSVARAPSGQYDVPPLSIRGVEGHLPPEKEISPRTDIYSLGATLWVLCTGESWAEDRKRRNWSATPLMRILRSLVEIDARRRPATVAEVKAALLGLRQSSTSGVLESRLVAWLASAA